MSTLVLLRHAKSDWSEAVPDEQRPLAPRGRRDAPAVGRWLAQNLPDIEMVLVSPAERAQLTWALAVDELNPAPPWRIEPELYFGSLQSMITVIAGENAETLVVVGHNPSLENLVERLTGEQVKLKTSTIAQLDVADRLAHAELIRVETIRG